MSGKKKNPTACMKRYQSPGVSPADCSWKPLTATRTAMPVPEIVPISGKIVERTMPRRRPTWYPCLLLTRNVR